MYSLVLMTAMTAAPETTQFNGFFYDLFCGCRGSSSASYSGTTVPYYSCYGGCSGCNGSSYASGNCSGCTGSTGSLFTTGCCGCNGCSGCNGEPFWSRVRRFFEWNGCCGCCGGSASYSCYGSYAYGCQGYAMPAGTYPVIPPYPYSVPPAPAPGVIPYAPPESAPAYNPQNTGFRPYTAGSSALTGGNPGSRATVVIRLPTDARLFAESRQLNLTGSERRFVTPELAAGQDYGYKFRVEYDRNGETLSVTRRVVVRPGTTVNVEFADMTVKAAPEKNAGSGNNSVASATPTSNTNTAATGTLVRGTTTATASHAAASPAAAPPAAQPQQAIPQVDRAYIRVKLPAGATLYVDDQRNPSADPIRQFSTPPLPVGREYAYQMKAEMFRNGRVETVTQRVPFHAGERIDVDFTTDR